MLPNDTKALSKHIVSFGADKRKWNTSSCAGCYFYTYFQKGMVHMKIEKLKSGSYRIRKMYKGVTYTVVTDYKPTQREAIKLLDAEMDKAKVSKVHMTFKNAAQAYIDTEKNVLSPSSVRGYKSISKSLSDDFNKILISDMTSMDIQKEINNYSVGHSPKTVHNVYSFIVCVLKAYNPNVIINVTLPKKQRKEPYIPIDEDVKRLLDEARGTKYELPILLSMCGLRRSEICAITNTDIDGNILTINKAKVIDSDGNIVVKKTGKTPESTRKIFVPDEIADKIRECDGEIYDGSPDAITNFVSRKVAKLGIKHFSLHKLRHYYASLAHSLGVPDQYIMHAGGWRSDNVMKSVYRHALQDKEMEMQEITANYISNKLIE